MMVFTFSFLNPAMKSFFKNPLQYLLNRLGYEIKEPSPIAEYIKEFSSSSYIQDRINNNDLDRYSYQLYTK